jgi:glycosyltransferase involved in cell wall biosynthesis
MRINNPLVSVVMAVFNGEKFILESINSIIKQTYKNWELIIVNDHSQDSTNQILNKYKSKKIKIINLKKNIGAYKAITIGLTNAKGKYIAILDSDDIAHPYRIINQVKVLDTEENVALVTSWYKKIDSNNRIIKKIKIPLKKNYFSNRFPCINLICNSSVMFRKNILNKIKYYNKNFIYSYDYNFFLKVFIKYKIKIINKFYTSYRVHNNQMSQSRKLKRIIYNENLKHLKWAKNHGLINKKNIILYFKNYLINYFKLLINY